MVASAPRWPALRIRTISSNRSMAPPGFSLRRAPGPVKPARRAGWTAPAVLTNIAPGFEERAMKALVFDRHGGPEVLQYREVADPQAGPGEVLVRVGACALNHLDLWVR